MLETIKELGSSVDWAMIAVWGLSGTLLFIGFLGTFLPLLPGPLLIFLGTLLHHLLRPESGLSWQGVAWSGVLLALSYLLDFLAGALGAKWFGGTRWGIIGALLGGVIGLFFGIVGLLLGPLAGALIGEMVFARQTLRPAAKATWGTLIGTLLGVLARVGIAILMLLVFFLDLGSSPAR